MAKLFTNSEDPYQMPASDLGLHCLPITLFMSPDYNGLRYSNLIFFFFFFCSGRVIKVS